MKTTESHTPGLARFGACILATLGLGMISALATPTVKVNIGGEEFGKGLNIDVSSGDWKLSPSKAYSYKLQGTCTGTGALAKLLPAGTPISTFLNLLKSGNSSTLSGVFDNPTGKFPFVALDETYTGTRTLPSIGAVTMSAKFVGGTLANGEAYLKVSNVSFTSATPTPIGTIKFDKGAAFIISTAPQIQFNAVGQAPVSEGAGSISLLVTRYGNTKGKATAQYATADDTASSIGNIDYTAQTGTVTFANKETQKTISIPISNNILKDGTRRFTITLSAPNVGTVLGTKVVNTVAISDND